MPAPIRAAISQPAMAFLTGPPLPLRNTRQSCLRTALLPSKPPHQSPINQRARAAPKPTTLTMVATSPSKQPPPPSPTTETYDVVVIGGGPAGLSLASGLGARGVRVLCADITLHKPWPNNYGTWVDELEPLGLSDCTSHQWPRASAFVRKDGSKSALSRAYARVDRIAMKERFLQRCAATGNVTIVHAAASSVDVQSDPSLSYVHLEMLASDAPTKCTVAGSVIVDATGHNLRFVDFQPGKKPCFQAAYGIECIVSDQGYPFDSNEMLLMDFRDDHMQATEQDKRMAQSQPTFIYVMPLDEGKGRRVFFEETSLVASPAMDFEALKERLYKRLSYYNIEVESILDEEFCLIPMGGAMPELRQRVVAFGGSAALVHPATGYMIARALTLADSAARIIAEEIAHKGDEANADVMAHRIWDRIWNFGRQRQRDFFNFGGEYLASIDLDTTREFFSAFFDLPIHQWSAFLSFRLMQPLQRLVFGLGIFARTSNRLRFALMFEAIVKGQLPLILSVLPLYRVADEE